MNNLGEPSHATPAISDGQIFLRTDRHICCIADEQLLRTGLIGSGGQTAQARGVDAASSFASARRLEFAEPSGSRGLKRLKAALLPATPNHTFEKRHGLART